MKRILTVITLILLSVTSNAQNIKYVRAESVQLATRNSTKQDWVWDKETRSVDILIKIESSKLTIYSKRAQVYRVISLLKDDTNASKWWCSDASGVNCYLYIFNQQNNGNIIIGIEYSDALWYYVGHLE